MNEGYITVIGSLNCDIIFKQERLPQRGETFTADSVSYCAGGKGANQAVQCAKLGVKTYMVGKLGNDFFGDYLYETLCSYGVDAKYMLRSCENTGLAAVNALQDGAVYATISAGANFDINSEDIKRLEELIRGSRILLLQMEIPMSVIECVIDLASFYGVYIILNAAPAKEMSEASLRKVDCLVVNEAEAGFYLSRSISSVEAAQESYPALLERVRETLIITLGSHGSLLCNSNGCRLFRADQSIKAVETTGAGDSYIGGFAYRKFWGDSDEDACLFAGRAAGYTITKIGAQIAMPTLQELDEGSDLSPQHAHGHAH